MGSWTFDPFKLCIKSIFVCICRTETEDMLMTSSMRQAQKEARMDKYPRVIIRVHFPERVILQGVFNVRESGRTNDARH